MLTNEIRKKFLQYFKERDHTLVPSSPVVPHDDPTILFTNAGMNQFKDVFLGASKRDYTRAVTSQKCIRVGGKHNDLDNVGHTSRHMTFFEMLGNFSFGDYFKKEAIRFAWEVSTEIFQFPEEKIWISVFETDDEAFELWSQIVNPKRIVRLGAKDNFWAMGDVGPCGPCSELLLDRGARFGSASTPYEDMAGERFFEFWNLVFMESNRDEKGVLSPLPSKNIDTGAGLERVVSFKMGVDSVFQIDLMQALIGAVERVSGKKYEAGDHHLAPAFHVIADHLRTLAFAIADGAQPSNVERGYVLRKILRRATRYAKRLHIEEPFLAKLLPPLTDLMGESYPELKQSEARATEILTLEEESFYRTLKRGGNILSHIIEKSEKSANRQITGEDAFKLKDTYGFPLEEILLIAKDSDLEVNLDAYELLEEQAKERSRAGSKVKGQEASESLFKDFVEKHGASEFIGYEEDQCEATVLALIVDGSFVEMMDEGQNGLIVLDKTPFYAEKGGQVADTGVIEHHGATFEVNDVQNPFPDVIVHSGALKKGTLLLGEPVNAKIDLKRRLRIAAHHSATHILHWALEKVLGEHVKQGGSLVERESLRFDFSHHKQMTQDEVREVEMLVNHKIRDNLPIKTSVISFEEAQKKSDIKQIFGEKYGSEVRVVALGDFSKELCGGTHAFSTGSLGYFRILKESSVGAGLRRIEAACGPLSEAYAYEKEDLIEEASELMGTPSSKFLVRLRSLLDETRDLKESLKKMRALHLRELSHDLLNRVEKIGAAPLLTAQVDVESDEMALLGNQLMDQLKSGIILLALVREGRCQVLLKVSDDWVQKGIHANALIKEIGPLIRGGGGGKKEAAQAGGQNPAGLESAFEKLRDLLKTTCS